MERRSALNWLGALSATAITQPSSILKDLESKYQNSLNEWRQLDPDTQDEEAFWQQVRQAYSVSPSIINLNNGGVSPQPRVVQEAVEFYNRMSNELPSYYMWRVLDQGREP
ncbi:MAG TPA: aminotransferase, partial [Saprospiraceae bacterium]|nr:aminotransferase [Saprospiraceae bacterium]